MPTRKKQERDARKSLDSRYRAWNATDKKLYVTDAMRAQHEAEEEEAGHKLGVKTWLVRSATSEGQDHADPVETTTGHSGIVETSAPGEEGEEEEEVTGRTGASEEQQKGDEDDEDEEKEEKDEVTGRSGAFDEIEIMPVSEQSASSTAVSGTASQADVITTTSVDSVVEDTKTTSASGASRNKQTSRSVAWKTDPKNAVATTTTPNSSPAQGEDQATQTEEEVKGEETSNGSKDLEEAQKSQSEQIGAAIKKMQDEFEARTAVLVAEYEAKLSAASDRRKSFDEKYYHEAAEHTKELAAVKAELKSSVMQVKELSTEIEQAKLNIDSMQSGFLAQMEELTKKSRADSDRADKSALVFADLERQFEDLSASRENTDAELSALKVELTTTAAAVTAQKVQLNEERLLRASLESKHSVLLSGLNDIFATTFDDSESIEELTATLRAVIDKKPKRSFSEIVTTIDIEPSSVLAAADTTEMVNVENQPRESVSAPVLGNWLYQLLFSLFLLVITTAFIDQYRQESLLSGTERSAQTITASHGEHLRDSMQRQLVMGTVEAWLGLDRTLYG